MKKLFVVVLFALLIFAPLALVSAEIIIPQEPVTRAEIDDSINKIAALIAANEKRVKKEKEEIRGDISAVNTTVNDIKTSLEEKFELLSDKIDGLVGKKGPITGIKDAINENNAKIDRVSGQVSNLWLGLLLTIAAVLFIAWRGRKYRKDQLSEAELMRKQIEELAKSIEVANGGVNSLVKAVVSAAEAVEKVADNIKATAKTKKTAAVGTGGPAKSKVTTP